MSADYQSPGISNVIAMNGHTFKYRIYHDKEKPLHPLYEEHTSSNGKINNSAFIFVEKKEGRLQSNYQPQKLIVKIMSLMNKSEKVKNEMKNEKYMYAIIVQDP